MDIRSIQADAEGDRLYGRGTTDMKGFLASVLAAADCIDASRLKRPLHIAFSYDEEIGCVGVRPLIDVLGARQFKAAICLVGEPTSMQIATGHKGKTAARAMFTGEAGHSSLAPRYVNAIHLACDFVATLRNLQSEVARSGVTDIPYSTIHAGRISGGVALNIVADRASVDFEIRNVAGDNVSEFLERLQIAVPSAEIAILNAYPGLVTQNDNVVARVRALVEGASTTKVSFGTEAGLFSEKLNIDTVVIGPGNMDQGHHRDEYIEHSDIMRCDEMLERLLDRWNSCDCSPPCSAIPTTAPSEMATFSRRTAGRFARNT